MSVYRVDNVRDSNYWVCELSQPLWEPFGNTHHKGFNVPCLPVDPEIPLLRTFPKEINMGRFVLGLGYSSSHCSMIFTGETLGIKMVKEAGKGLELLCNGWPEPVCYWTSLNA